MAENTKIEWADHTFNPWIGCTKISQGCKSCYAETFAGRYMKIPWGNHDRHITAPSTWAQPLQWQRKAEKLNTQYRVFTASLADVFEDRPELVVPRARLFDLIERTPNLTWMVLTKRLQDVERLLPEAQKVFGLSRNVWLMTSICTQKEYDRFKPILDDLKTKYRIAVTGISFEPLLENIDLHLGAADWNIVGGESGFLKHTRKLEMKWVDQIYRTCLGERKAFFFKQTGVHLSKLYGLQTPSGTDIENLPSGIRYLALQQLPGDMIKAKEILAINTNQLTLF